MLTVVNAGRSLAEQLSVSPRNIRCDGSWITAGVDDAVNRAQYIVVPHRVNGVWNQVDREAAYSAGTIRAGIRQLACNSN